MKILAFAASNSFESINKRLVNYTCDLLSKKFKNDLEIEVLDLNDFEMPIYRPDREKDNGIPEPAKLFYKKIGEADALLISFAEHNSSYTTAYKNLFDWTSRIQAKVYQNKPVFLMATSPGKRGGASVLKTASDVAPFYGMDVKGTFSLPSFHENFDSSTNEIKNQELMSLLINSIELLVK